MSSSDPTDAAEAMAAATDEPGAPARDDVDADADAVSAEQTRQRFRALAGRWGVPLAALAWSLGVTIRTHLFFLLPYATPVSNDEGYLSAMALRMVRGHWLPYVDGVSQRGPLLYWLTAAVMRVGGLWSWVPMRLLGLALALTIVGLAFALSTALASPMAGAIGALACTYFLTYELNPWDGVGVNGEPLAVVFALAASLLIVRMQSAPEGTVRASKRRSQLAWTGVLVACAGLSKQMFLLHGVPIGLWVLLGAPGTGSRAWRERGREVGWLALGFAVPYALVVAIYVASGHWSEFWYYYQRYGREIFMDPLTPEFIRDKLREQIDKYFIGIAGVGGVWFYAVARALRATLASPPGAAEPSAPPPARFAPESHVVLNVLAPGAGLVATRSRRTAVVGVLALLASLGILAARFFVRRARGIPYDSHALTSDVAIWLALGVATAVATGVWLARAAPAARWAGFERLREHAPPWFAIAECACAFAGACFTFRFFPHYFVEFFPFASVIIGCVVAEGFGRLSSEDRPGIVSAATMVVGGALLLAIANSALARNVRIRRETDRWYQDPATDPIVRYVAERTTRDQTIFVWGFRAETYLSAHRYPGSRYVYTVYPAGVVPWFQSTHEEEERRVVPGSRGQLLEDLGSEQPELVIDAGRSMNGRYMYNYPQLRTYLDRNYCFMRYVDGEPVYRRRHGDRCPPADY